MAFFELQEVRAVAKASVNLIICIFVGVRIAVSSPFGCFLRRSSTSVGLWVSTMVLSESVVSTVESSVVQSSDSIGGYPGSGLVVYRLPTSMGIGCPCIAISCGMGLIVVVLGILLGNSLFGLR